jgi:hypothetical protein
MTFSRCLTRTGPTRPAGTSVRLPPTAIDPRPDWLIATCDLLDRTPDPVGSVYLLHFDRPIGDLNNPRGYAGHYTGWTLDLRGRLGDHAAGKGPKDGGARLVQVVRQAGIGFQLVRVWEGTRGLERSLKRRGGAARRCPVCRLQALGLTLPRRPTHPLDQLELGPAAAWLVTGRLVEAGQLELAA